MVPDPTRANDPILRNTTSDSFPNLLSPFRHGPLRLQSTEIPSRAQHLPDSHIKMKGLLVETFRVKKVGYLLGCLV